MPLNKETKQQSIWIIPTSTKCLYCFILVNIEIWSFEKFEFYLLIRNIIHWTNREIRRTFASLIELAFFMEEEISASRSGGFASSFLKCSFHFCCLYSWQAGFTFAFEILPFTPASYAVWCANVLPSFWFYWFSFCALEFLGFLLLSMLFQVISFFFNFYCFQWNFAFGSWFGWNALGCYFYMGVKVFIFVIQSMSFRCLVKSIKLFSSSNRIIISNITVGEWVLGIIGVLFLCRLRWIFAGIILGPEHTLSRGVSLTAHIVIYPLLVYEYLI